MPNQTTDKLFEKGHTMLKQAEMILKNTDHSLNKKVAEIFDRTVYATALFHPDPNKGFGISKHGPKEIIREELFDYVAICIVDKDQNPQWYEYVKERKDEFAYYSESFRTIFITSDLEISGQAAGLLLLHEMYHALRHMERGYTEGPNLHWSEEVEAYQYEIELAKQISSQYAEACDEHLIHILAHATVSKDESHISGLDSPSREFVAEKIGGADKDIELMGTLILLDVAFRFFEIKFPATSERDKIGFVEQCTLGLSL